MNNIFLIIGLLLVSIFGLLSIKKKEGNVYRYIQTGIFTLFLFLSLMSLILYSYPAKEEALMNGEMINTKEIIPGAQHDNFNFVTVKSGFVNNLFDRWFIQSMFWKEPTFYSAQNTTLEIRTSDEEKEVSKSFLDEGMDKVYLGVLNSLDEQLKYEKKLVVTSVFSSNKFKAADLIEKGDEILLVDGVAFTSREKLDQYLKESDGTEVKLVLERKEKVLEINLKRNRNYVGIHSLGFWPREKFKYDFPEQLLTIKNSKLDGGNSAGLLIGLQLYYEAKDKQIDKNLVVAGTGGLEEDGTVSPIGGVSYKVKACYDAGADIFFVPELNAAEALETQKKIGANSMKIISVKNLNEAIKYLDSL
ncbi:MULTISPECIES: PDZ domain-containing protein [Bacillota]|uniref:PDZ domain-containing protein n=1 Tax=Bacillota TaxID=1239 RepID=UPI0039EE2466